MIEFESLQQAVLVLDQGSFRKAAKVMHVRLSVVSRRVRALEDTIGVGLFQRQSRGAEPTVAGRRILEHARTILSDVEMLLRQAASSGQGTEGLLRFGVVTSLAIGFARDLIETFLVQYPGVAIDVIEGLARDHVASVKALKLDFTFVTGSPDAPGCEVERLWEERILVALPTGHPLASRPELAWEELADERFIVSRVDPGPQIEDYIVQHLASLGQRPRIEQVAVQRESLLMLVALRQGLSLVGAATAGISYPGLTLRPLDQEAVPVSIVWFTQNDNPAFRRFLSAARLQAVQRLSHRTSP